MPSFIKESMFKELAKEFENNEMAFFSSFDGLTVSDIADFRKSIEKVAGRSMVVKHTLAKKALSEGKWTDAEKFLKGQTIVTFGQGEPQAISKAIVDFSKASKKLVPAGVILDGAVHDDQFVNQLAKLPSRQDLLTQVVVRMQSPMSGFVMTLNQLVQGLVISLNEIKKQKEAQPKTA